MNELERAKHELRMQIATLQQFLRDRSEAMTEQQKNGVLDKLGVLFDYLRQVEEFEKNQKGQ